MKTFKIWCDSIDEAKEILAKMEIKGIVWDDVEETKPTSFFPPYTVFGLVVTNGKMQYSTNRSIFVDAISVKDYLKESKPFTLSDLKTGMIVTLRNGKEYVVFKDAVDQMGCNNVIVNSKENSWLHINGYGKDMKKTRYEMHEYDIVKVEIPRYLYCCMDLDKYQNERKVIWEEPAKEMTLAEIEALVGCKVKIINKE